MIYPLFIKGNMKKLLTMIICGCLAAGCNTAPQEAANTETSAPSLSTLSADQKILSNAVNKFLEAYFSTGLDKFFPEIATQVFGSYGNDMSPAIKTCLITNINPYFFDLVTPFIKESFSDPISAREAARFLATPTGQKILKSAVAGIRMSKVLSHQEKQAAAQFIFSEPGKQLMNFGMRLKNEAQHIYLDYAKIIADKCDKSILNP